MGGIEISIMPRLRRSPHWAALGGLRCHVIGISIMVIESSISVIGISIADRKFDQAVDPSNIPIRLQPAQGARNIAGRAERQVGEPPIGQTLAAGRADVLQYLQ